MPKKGGSVFDTPSTLLFLAGWRPQQCAIAAAHQGESGLNQTNGSITQVVGFPGAFWNLFGAKEDFRDFAVRTAVHSCIERTKCERQTTTALR